MLGADWIPRRREDDPLELYLANAAWEEVLPPTFTFSRFASLNSALARGLSSPQSSAKQARYAVIENEFGDAAIDEMLLDQGGAAMQLS